MSERFDELSRAMAGPRSRRGVLKLLGAAAAATVGAAVLKPFRGDATTCAAGTTPCGTICCSGTCSLNNGGNSCCCDAGTTPCGFRCCRAGIACVDRSRGVCGCPAGYASCGSATSLRCCPPGKPCGSIGCKSPIDPILRNYIFCSSQTCRRKDDTCFSDKQCCPGLTCSGTNEGISSCA